jgi:RNA polymerase sigma-70 factor (ECF subfamily)
LDDQDLISRAKSGDDDAFLSLVRFQQRLGLRVAYLIVRDAHEAEDVMQEAIVKAHRALARVRPDAEFRPWFLRIVRNEALNRRRSAGRRLALVQRAASVSGDAVPSPETETLANEQRQRLLGALDELPRGIRDVIQCRYLLELSERETASLLGVAPGTVKSRTSRGLERLRTVLEDQP